MLIKYTKHIKHLIKIQFNEVFFIKKVLILFGGNSSEHYVSCKSCESIVSNIDDELFDYEIVGIDFDNTWYKFKDDLLFLNDGSWKDAKIEKIDNIIDYVKQFDVVFPITHGKNGEDGKLQGMLELFGIPFVGCKTLASAICMDKEMSKIVFNDIKIKQVPYVTINKDYNLKDIIDELGLPLIVKPANGGSSIGISKANNKRELNKAIKLAKKYDEKVIIERFIKARELEVAVLENKENIICSSPGEINSANEFYDYDAKYVNESSYTIIPDDLPKDVLSKINEYAMTIFNKLGLKGYARIDFFYDEENREVYINEVNTLPGFTSISMYPKLMENEGIYYTDLITTLINNA